VDLRTAARLWRQDGFFELAAYLEGHLLASAVADLAEIYPSAEEYHADPSAPPNQRFNGDEFGGIVSFPFPSVSLCNLVTSEPIIRLAEAVFESGDVRIYASELWAKYTGAARYEQEHHRDYLNHTPLVPSDDIRWRGLELFIWLSDVPEPLGPTHMVPMSRTAELPPLPHVQTREQGPDLYVAEVSGAGDIGTVVAYSTETFHRGTELIEPKGARFSAHVSYRHPEATWLSRHAWGDRSFDPNWSPFVEQATPRQLALFGFPPPGHPYWTPQTIQAMAVRYPGMDLGHWERPP
jgi:hypothetical protein